MKDKKHVAAVACLVLINASIAARLGAAGGLDRSGPRAFELQREVRTLRPRVERAPRASSFDLKELQRRLDDRRIEDPPDPRLQDLALELHHLRARADRAARRPGIADLARRSTLSSPAPLAKPRYLGGAHTPAAAPPARPYFGQRVVTLQRSVAEIDTAAAARLLETAEADLATLRGVFGSAVAADPNLIALEAQIRALEGQLAPR